MEKIILSKGDRKAGSLIFLIFLAGFVFLIALHNYERYYVSKDYPVSVFTACDTSKNSCFMIDPELAFFSIQEGPYEKVEINASVAPACLDEHACERFSCEGIGGGCKITYCSEDVIEDGEFCYSEPLYNAL